MQEAQERRKRLKSLRDDADVPEAHATGTRQSQRHRPIL
jgi:hypothetical protein